MGIEEVTSVFSSDLGKTRLNFFPSLKTVWEHPLFSLIWSSSRRDILIGIFLSPLHAVTELLLMNVTAFLFQLIFVSSGEVPVQKILPREFVALFPQLLQTNRQELVTLVPMAVIAIGFVRLLTSFGSNYLLERAGHRVAHALRFAFLDSYLGASGKILDTRNPGELTNRILLDTTLMQGLVSKGAIGAFRDGLVVVGAAVWMLFKASQFVVGLACFFLLFFFLLRFVSRKLEFYARESARRQVQMSTRGMQMRQGLLAIYGMGAQQREKDDLNSLSQNYYSFVRRTIALRASFRPGMETLAVCLLAGAVWWRFSLGDEASVAEYSTLFILAAASFRPLKNVSSFISQFAELKAVWFRLVDEWDVTHRVFPSTGTQGLVAAPPSRSDLALEVRDVAFDALNGPRILHTCRLAIRKRTRVAFIGESGAGKSTLLRLMAGLLPPSEGSIVGVRDVFLATQTPYVFQGTVFENICYPQMPTQPGQMNRARERASAIVLNLMLAHTPSGAELFLNKKVGYMGEGLSGGEKARVSLARLLYADKPVLLLDEPTANLDQQSASAFWSSVWAWQRQEGVSRTVVAVTHHLKDLAEFDECHLFSDGKLVASGTPAKILEIQERLGRERKAQTPFVGIPSS